MTSAEGPPITPETLPPLPTGPAPGARCTAGRIDPFTLVDLLRTPAPVIPLGELLAQRRAMIADLTDEQLGQVVRSLLDAEVSITIGPPGAPASAGGPAITCPRCGAVSRSAGDIAQGYCGNCHEWTGGEVTP